MSTEQSLVSSFCAFIQSYDVMNRMFSLHSCDVCDLIGAAIYLQWGQVSLVPSTGSDGKLGGAWERG